MRLAALAMVAAAAPAHAGLAPRSVAMTAADDDVCDLLRSDKHDRCKPLAHTQSATVYQAGSALLRRVVLAIDTGDATLIGPSIDLAPTDGAKLVSTTPTVRVIQLDGRPGLVLDVVTEFRADRERWQTESIVGCGRTAAGAWKCAQLEVGRCTAEIAQDGGVTTSCGDRAQLSLER